MKTVNRIVRLALISAASLVGICAIALITIWLLRRHPNNNATLAIEPLKEFAIAYSPKDEKYGKLTEFAKCHLVPQNIHDDVAYVLKHRIIDNDYKLYVSLVILKLYNCHYEISGLGHGLNEFSLEDLWNFNPFYRAYNNIVDNSEEYLTTFEIINWLDRHNEFMGNEAIIKELHLTCALHSQRNDKLAFCDSLAQPQH